MKITTLLALFLSLIFCNVNAKTTSSQASGPWEIAGTWDNGVPAMGDVVNILAAHAVTLTTAYDNTGGTINASGILLNGAGGSFTVVGTININAGGTYQHGQDGGTIPNCIWDVASTCLITGITTTVPGGLGQSFGNVTWSTSLGALLNLNGALTTIRGDFLVTNIAPLATRILYLSQATDYALDIDGDFIVNNPGGTDVLQFCTSTSPLIDVGGDFSIATSGRVVMSTTGTPVMNIAGDFSNTSATANAFTMASTGNATINLTGNFNHLTNASNGLLMSTGANGLGTINVGGDFTYNAATGARIRETGGGTSKGRFFFTKAGVQLFSSSVSSPFGNTIQLTVNSGSTLDMSASAFDLSLSINTSQSLTVNGTLLTGTNQVYVRTGTTFDLTSGGTLDTDNSNGVDSTIAGTSTEGTGTRNFHPAANYILGGASTTTGFTGSSTTMNDLTTTANTTLGEAITVNGIMLHSAGTFTTSDFTINAATLTNAATFNAGASAINVTGTLSNTGTYNANTSTTSAGALTNDGTITALATTIGVTGAFTNSSSGTFNANTGTLNIGGDFTNDGAFNANTGTVGFNGATQTLGGTSTTTFYNITHSSSVGTSLAQDANLIGVLAISSGTVTTTGYDFTLVSDASGTARIAEITGGDFAGNIIMQRYVENSPTDWRFFCSAVEGSTIADWADDFATSGFTGATCGPTDCATCSVCNYPSIYWYDESAGGDLEQGYEAVQDVNDPILDGTGYWVYLGPNPVTFEVTGPPNRFDKPLSVNYNPNNGDADDGWNLVANPYPCTIDWDDADWTITNREYIADAIYVYNASTGTYAYHVADSLPVDGNGGSRYIASQQAFWVKANDIVYAPVLTAVEGVKASAADPQYLRTKNTPNTSYYPSAFKDFPVPLNTNSTPGRLKLTASGNGYDDEIFVRFRNGATDGFDGKYDAWKLIHPNYYVHNFSSVSNGSDLSVNSLPELSSDVHVPLRLTVPSTGVYKISRDSILMLPLSSCVILEDKATGSMIDLRTVVTYSFTISDTTAAPRFILHIYAPVSKSAVNVSCAGASNGLAVAKGVGVGPWDYTWKNSAGIVVKTTTGSLTADTLFNCSSGTYSVTVNGAVCGTVTDTIQVVEPSVLATTSSFINVSCFGDNNGSALITPAGGTPSYSYQWDNGQTTSAVVNLSEGSYSVMVTDSKGCTSTASVSITQPAALSNSVSHINVSCFGGNNGSASVLVSGGTASYSYLWETWETTSVASNLSEGSYSVSITDANGCTSSAFVSIIQPAALTNTVAQTNASCYGGNDGSLTIAVSGGSSPYSFVWGSGQTTSTAVNLSSGNYSVTITDANGCTAGVAVAITEPAALVAGYTANTYTLDIALDSSVAFVNTSIGATSYSWNFGDGSVIDASVNPVHNYSATGTYTVMLISADGPCSDTTYNTIEVVSSNPTALNQSQYNSNINVGYENGGVFLIFTLGKETRVNISVYNMLGDELFSRNDLLVKNAKIRLELPSTAAGVYIAVSEMTDAIVSKKIIIPAR